MFTILLTLTLNLISANDKKIEPISLIQDRTLLGWNNSNFQNSSMWSNIGDVKIDENDSSKLYSIKGSGVLFKARQLPARNLLSNMLHADLKLHIEFLIPKNGDSGIYLMGRYGIDLKDSHGSNFINLNTCGAISQIKIPNTTKYTGGTPPISNAFNKLGQWQSLDVTFRAPRFNKLGKKTTNAQFIEVYLNNTLIHYKVEVEAPTRGYWYIAEEELGPLMLQGNSGDVAFRNILVTHIFIENYE